MLGSPPILTVAYEPKLLSPGFTSTLRQTRSGNSSGFQTPVFRKRGRMNDVEA